MKEQPVDEVLALLFALVFPTLVAWAYFVALAQGGRPSLAQQAAYGAGKVIQFAFPLAFVLLWQRRRLHWSRPSRAGLALGLGFGLLVATALLTAYFAELRSSPLLAQTPARIRTRLQEFGLTSPAAYLACAVFYCAIHSLLEEYYWRWFVFGRLRALLPLGPALVLASAAFAAHHVVVLWVFLPGKVLTGVLPGGLAVAVGGAMWAWIYERAGSLVAPWLSHLLSDATLFAIGWDLLTRAGTGV
jgi:membrane protease YdiL (CAAX protease family)